MSIPELLRFVWNHPLNAGNRTAALGRVARWQVASRLMAGPIALPFVDGTSLFVSRGMTGATGNWYCGLHEVQDMAFVLHLLRPGDGFLDAGANVGTYTILAAGAAGARVTAVEPIPSTFAHLQRNIVLNGLEPLVHAVRCGLSNRAGRLRFTADLDTVNHVVADHEKVPAVEVPVRTADDLLGGACPALIKIDVEGHEHPVLEGAARTLADARLLAVVMETNGSGSRYGIQDQDLFALMARHGFDACTYDPFARRMIDLPPGAGNSIFIRHRAAVEARLRDARSYQLINGTI